jgi:hypothetical protein
VLPTNGVECMLYLGTSEYAAGSSGSRSSVFFFLALASIKTIQSENVAY